MSSNDKDRIGGDICKHHAARAEKDLSRVCPSKLSKRELEDLYYSLLDNNLELKKAVNSQNEKIRLLTTKVNRMTAQSKSYLPKDQRDCCAGAKAIITDQKVSIADLKKANECMSERIKRLNMRLCSAKQFLKKSPSQTINKCYKCFSGACTSVKNQSTSALNTKGSDSDLKNQALCDSESPVTRTVETNTIQWEHLIQHLSEKSCDENKCRSTMDELKQKIVDLKEELSRSHGEHSQRMSQLEQQVGRLQAVARSRSDHATCRDRDATRAEGEREKLQLQLSTEKMKVAELETRLKAAKMSKDVAAAIEKHLEHDEKLEESPSHPRGKKCVCNVCCPRYALAATANTQTEIPRISRMFNPTFEDKQTTSDDSGYAEQHQDSQSDGMISKINEEFMNKIAYLQEQLNYIKSVLIGPSSDIPSKSTFNSYEAMVKDTDVPVLKNVKDYKCFIVDPESKVIVEIAHVNKDITDDDETVDSDIEGNYNEKVKTKDQSILSGYRSTDIQLKEERYDDEKGITLYDVHSDTDLKPSAGQRKTSISIPGNVKQEVIFNDTVKPLEGYESSLENGPEKEMEERDHSVVAPPTRQCCETSMVKSKKKVICKCPPPSDSEAAKTSETPDSRRQSHDIFDSNVRPSNSQEGLTVQSKVKPDTHNSLQIPGPLPISKTESIISKTGKASKKLDHMKSKDNSDISAVGIPEDKKVSEPIDKVNEEEVCDSAKCRKALQILDETSSKIADSENVSVGKNIPEKEKTVQNKPETNENIAKLNDIDEIIKPSTSKENMNVIKFGDVDTAVNERMDVPDQPLNDVENTVVRGRTVKEEVKRLNENAIELAVCCGGKNNPIPDKQFDTKPACLKDTRRPSSAGNTYTLPTSEAKCSRASSPDNTEHEISFMSDLPTEKEGTSHPSRSSTSPGEDKMTTTYRESYTPCHWSSLSEGEVPNAPKPKRKLSISIGEHPGDEYSSTNPHFPEAASEKMEAALQSISRELVRCRAMLHSRPREPSKSSRDAETLTSELNREESIQLRRTKANPSIGGATAPKCVFILHIGTIVLSDEAVINSRDAPLMLTWKFFDQNAAMTRMSPGRVVHFDFSTEYEVKMTEDFVEYMKHAEMPIKICEMDDKENLFAMCTLPLREALLNANRRADLSLELVTALETNRKAHDSLDTSDEVGVLDLWCLLRAEPRNLMALQKYCGLNSTGPLHQPKGKMADIIDDVQSFDYALSQDLEMEVHSVSKQKLESVLENDKKKNMLNQRRGSQTPQKDFYVPEWSKTSMPPSNADHTPRHQKLGAPSVTSNLRMASFEGRPMMSNISNINAPSVDVTRPGVILTEVTPKVPALGESTTDFKRQHDIVYQSYDTFNEKQLKKRRGSRSGNEDATSYRDLGSSPNVDNWRAMGTESNPTMKEIKPRRELPSLESESLSRKKYREAGGAAAKLLNPPKELQSMESESISPKKLRDNSTQSMDGIKKVTIAPNNYSGRISKGSISKNEDRVIEITVLWLALNEECDAMMNPNVRRLYVAYSFLGRDGAELETPVSLPKPKYYIEKCFFNFKKTFHLTEFDMPILEHMAKCRSLNRKSHNSKDCIVFSVVSEPPEDPLGLENCEDIGYAYLYLGDLLAYGAGDTFTQVLPVRAAGGDGVCGVLAVRLDGLAVLRARARL